MVEQQICEEMQQLFTVGQRNDQVEDKLEYNVDIVRVSAKSGAGIEELRSQNPEMCKKAERNVENPCISKTSCGQSIFNERKRNSCDGNTS